MEQNIFELASRQKLRFMSAKGELTTEQLWDLPLLGNPVTLVAKADLDTVARSISRELKEQVEESFVATRANPLKAKLELQLEVVKHIIAVKMAEAEAKTKAADTKRERERLLEILANKKEQELLQLSPEEIQKRIDALG